MEEARKLAFRDPKLGEPLTVIPLPPAVPFDRMPREPHLLDYVIILRKHQWLILTFLLTVVTVVTIASFKMKPVYQATARVEVDRESQNNMQFQDQTEYDDYMDSEDYIETQTKILAKRNARAANDQINGPWALPRIRRHCQLAEFCAGKRSDEASRNSWRFFGCA